jgi:hypothetical protein
MVKGSRAGRTSSLPAVSGSTRPGIGEAMGRVLSVLIAVAVFAAAGALVGCGHATAALPSPSPTQRPPSGAQGALASPVATPGPAAAVWPSSGSLAGTERWLRGRAGVTALAVVDSRGRLHGYEVDRRSASASVVKAMLLVQYLRTHGTVSQRERVVLTRMIVDSDNAATDRVFAQVGTGGLVELARAAGMGHFSPSRVWALSKTTAADQARFFYRIDGLVPRRHRAFLERVLGEHGPYRGWGIPQAALLRGWHVWWKDGWMHSAGGELLLQVARLERGGVVFAVAVIADGQPTSGYGVATMRGVGRRLLR